MLTGADGVFCAGADLKGVAEGRGNRVTEDGDGPMGPTRMLLDKPVIAAVEGYAVAGGLELALWCDLRVAARDAVFGVFCRRWGVPLVDGGTVRLAADDRPFARARPHPHGPRRLRRRSRSAWVSPTGSSSRDGARLRRSRSRTISPRCPQVCMRHDRMSSYEQWALTIDDAMQNEYRHALETLASGEALAGATRFSAGAGRHGAAGDTRTDSHQRRDEEEGDMSERQRKRARSATS